MSALPDNNPKTRQGVKKVPMHLVPPVAVAYAAQALEDGAKKYGPYNWRDESISVSTYVSAAKRHLDAYWDGEAVAEDSGQHHLAHAIATLAILIDALEAGCLHDDRPKPGGFPAFLERTRKKD